MKYKMLQELFKDPMIRSERVEFRVHLQNCESEPWFKWIHYKITTECFWGFVFNLLLQLFGPRTRINRKQRRLRLWCSLAHRSNFDAASEPDRSSMMSQNQQNHFRRSSCWRRALSQADGADGAAPAGRGASDLWPLTCSSSPWISAPSVSDLHDLRSSSGLVGCWSSLDDEMKIIADHL